MQVPQLLSLAGLLIFAYLLGAVPFGLILVRRFKSVDLREIGSGNIGATNARRAGGWPLGLATLCLDIVKGGLPVYLAGVIFAGATNSLAVSLTAAAAFCGHLFPVYLKFKTGGKGVATAAGCFAVISPASLLIALGIFLLLAVLSNKVSVGSIAAAVSLPLAVLLLERDWLLIGCAAAIALMILLRHKDNIRRLIAGTEPSLR
jgi:glycerol-3-phosphate acyltransferase PlsY